MCFCLLTVISAAADELEILSNSGSEYGWMCCTNWVRSRTGQDCKGDYQFVLPNDTHSGVPSLEIRCAGRDCEKAAIVSYTPPGQAYELTLYSNCPAGRLALLYVAGTATGHAGLWLANVGVSGQAATVDGAPCLALGFVDLGFADLASAAAVEANTVRGVGKTAARCINTWQQSYLDRAYEAGLNVLPESSTTARLRVPELYAAIMPRFGPRLANIANLWLAELAIRRKRAVTPQ